MKWLHSITVFRNVYIEYIKENVLLNLWKPDYEIMQVIMPASVDPVEMAKKGILGIRFLMAW